MTTAIENAQDNMRVDPGVGSTYLILKNTDMTEGRGPMVLMGIGFAQWDEAKAYVETLWHYPNTKWTVSGDKHYYGMYAISTIIVFKDSLQARGWDLQKEKNAALRSLTQRQREILGLPNPSTP